MAKAQGLVTLAQNRHGSQGEEIEEAPEETALIVVEWCIVGVEACVEEWGKCHSLALDLTSFALTGNPATLNRAETNAEMKKQN